MNRATAMLVRRRWFHRLASAPANIRIARIRVAAPGPAANAAKASPPSARTRPSRQSRPRSNWRSKPMFFHSPVQRGAGQPEFGGGKRDIICMLDQGALDDVALGAIEVEVFADRKPGQRDA